jgi:hypothetical protein
MREVPQRLVFIDETSVKTNMTRLRGRSPVGERLFGVAPFGRWQTQTFIAGLTFNDFIAPWVIPGAMNRKAFDTYIETQLAPALEPGTVVVLDNLVTHKSPKAVRVLKRFAFDRNRRGLNEIATAILEPDVTAKAPV